MIDAIAAFIKKIFYPVSGALSLLGGMLIIVMMFFTFVTVILRYLFNSPVPGDFELIVFTLVILVAFAISYTMVNDRHVTVTFFSFPRRVQAIVNIFTHLFALCIFGLASWQTFAYGSKLLKYGQYSAILHLPDSIFIYLLAFGLFLLCIVLLVKILSYIGEAMKR